MPRVGRQGQPSHAPAMLGDWAELNVPLSAVENGGTRLGFLKGGDRWQHQFCNLRHCAFSSLSG